MQSCNLKEFAQIYSEGVNSHVKVIIFKSD